MLTVTEKVVLVAFDHSGKVLTEATDLTLGYALSSALRLTLPFWAILRLMTRR